MADPSSRSELRRRRAVRHRYAIGALALLIVVAAGGLLLATRGDDRAKASAAPTSRVAAHPPAGAAITTSFSSAPLRAATTKGGDIAVYATPDAAAQPVSTLSAQTQYTLPRTLLAFDQYQGWLHVYLPTRPNDSTGWVKASDVTVSAPLVWQIKVSLAEHQVTLLHNGAVVFTAPAAIGTPDDPTPTGTFYYTDPIDLATQPDSAYGVFAIGLSGHSNALSEFEGGDAQIAIHGTDDPGSIGDDVSHGCVRVDNDVILKLAQLPLGTPVVIT